MQSKYNYWTRTISFFGKMMQRKQRYYDNFKNNFSKKQAIKIL